MEEYIVIKHFFTTDYYHAGVTMEGNHKWTINKEGAKVYQSYLTAFAITKRAGGFVSLKDKLVMVKEWEEEPPHLEEAVAELLTTYLGSVTEDDLKNKAFMFSLDSPFEGVPTQGQPFTRLWRITSPLEMIVKRHCLFRRIGLDSVALKAGLHTWEMKEAFKGKGTDETIRRILLAIRGKVEQEDS